MKKFILLLGLMLCFATVAGTSQTEKVWVINGKNIPAVSSAKTLVEHLAESLPDPQELKCLSKNIYFEAAVESTAGKIAVAMVTMNRVRATNYPNSICAVIKQGPHYSSGHPKRNRCQFSWYCDGKHDRPNESPAWRISQKVAAYVIRTPTLIDITDGATHYHADYINTPRWALLKEKTVTIDTHLFYNKQIDVKF